ncbi:MAG: hypothetical protein JZU52_12225 [Lamprocystis purpurea]|uniref:hypothetical protein n=1 Tax=Lamprocystis purpurea TaxID=61598 RepID=UPI001B7F7FD2|nr:hypothetical protein [Lamprocystis purpurea]MBV5274363.1 hypothetical protein [Lamprocystis purpurea]
MPLPSPSFNATVFGSEIRLALPEATMKKALMAFLLMCCFKPLFAYGPDTVAFADRSLWPETMNSTAAFDRASRAEILVKGWAVSSSTHNMLCLISCREAGDASIFKPLCRCP